MLDKIENIERYQCEQQGGCEWLQSTAWKVQNEKTGRGQNQDGKESTKVSGICLIRSVTPRTKGGRGANQSTENCNIYKDEGGRKAEYTSISKTTHPTKQPAPRPRKGNPERHKTQLKNTKTHGRKRGETKQKMARHLWALAVGRAPKEEAQKSKVGPAGKNQRINSTE